jgi:DNA adenine methylase
MRYIAHQHSGDSLYLRSIFSSELINSYMVVKDNVEKLIGLLKLHEVEYKKAPEEYYYKLRSNYNAKLANVTERTAQFITLNRTCFNGLYRVNSSGEFNVPKGKYTNPLICDSSNLRNVCLALGYSNVEIKASDYKQVLLENTREGDFIYLDPPYNPESSTAYFTGYTNNGFSNKDQRELADIFRKLDDRKCKVLLSNSSTPLIKELYSDFAKYIKEIDGVRRSINSKGTGRGTIRNCLFTIIQHDYIFLI